MSRSGDVYVQGHARMRIVGMSNLKALPKLLALALGFATCPSAMADTLQPRVGRSTEDFNAVLLDYEPASGDLRVYQMPQAEHAIRRISIASRSGILLRQFVSPCLPVAPFPIDTPVPEVIIGPFDVFVPGRRDFSCHLDEGLSDVLFAGLIRTGLTEQFLVEDLLVAGNLTSGEPITDVVFWGTIKSGSIVGGRMRVERPLFQAARSLCPQHIEEMTPCTATSEKATSVRLPAQ